MKLITLSSGTVFNADKIVFAAKHEVDGKPGSLIYTEHRVWTASETPAEIKAMIEGDADAEWQECDNCPSLDVQHSYCKGCHDSELRLAAKFRQIEPLVRQMIDAADEYVMRVYGDCDISETRKRTKTVAPDATLWLLFKSRDALSAALDGGE